MRAGGEMAKKRLQFGPWQRRLIRSLLLLLLFVPLVNMAYEPVEDWVYFQRNAYWWQATPILCGEGTVYSARVRTLESGELTCTGEDGGAVLSVNGKEYLIKLEPDEGKFQYGYSDSLVCFGEWQDDELSMVGYAPYSVNSGMQCTAWELTMRAIYMHRK